jgi:galactonate dehydratase
VLHDVWRNLVFLKVETDEGVTGIGEASLTNRDEGVLGYLEGAVQRHVLGSDPRDIEGLWLRMYRDDFWRGVVRFYGSGSARGPGGHGSRARTAAKQ